MVPLTVLIAEDDDGHAALVKRHLRRAGLVTAPVHVRDGQELLDYLYRRGPWIQRSTHEAVMILLDLNMPRLGGLEVLGTLKRDVRFAHIPVFVLTTSDNPAELDACYSQGASACLIKPLEYGAFGQLLHRLGEFLASVRMPPESQVRNPYVG